MAWQKTTESLEAAFDRALPDDPRVARKRMFGCPCAFVNGNMFAGVFQDRLFLRLDEGERGALLAQPDWAPFEPMAGRPMREYVVAPPALVAEGAQLRAWVARALEHGASLPPKQPKSPKPRR